MSNVIHVCWPEVRSFRSHRYLGGTRVASWDNQLVTTHAVALVGDAAQSETVCGTTIEGEVVLAIGALSCWDCRYRLIDIGSTTGSRSLPK